ncbi:MAG: hypothetical protein ACXQTR_02520 [Candidatus Methanospirareceae archaeon]
MPYTTPSDIRILIDTTIDDIVIESIIEKVDAEIDDLLAEQGLSVGDSNPIPAKIKNASEYTTCARILSRDWAGGTTPDTHKIGEFSQKSGIQEQIAMFEAKGEKAIKDYIHEKKKGSYPDIFVIIENQTDTNM